MQNYGSHCKAATQATITPLPCRSQHRRAASYSIILSLRHALQTVSLSLQTATQKRDKIDTTWQNNNNNYIVLSAAAAGMK